MESVEQQRWARVSSFGKVLGGKERGFIIKREIVMSKMKFGISLFKSDHLTRVFFVGSGLIQKKAIVFVK